MVGRHWKHQKSIDTIHTKLVDTGFFRNQVKIRRDRLILVWNFVFESSKSDENLTLTLCTVVVTILGSKIRHNSGI